MTLGEWLNRMILEDDQPEDVFSESQMAERPTRAYFETPRPAETMIGRFEAPSHPGDEVGRMAAALDRLSHRIETSEARTGSAIHGVEQSVREALERIEAAERGQVSVAARFEGVFEEIASGQGKLSERLRRIEDDASGPRSAEALRSLEQALGKVATHLYDGEGRTREMMAAVEARLADVESRSGGAQANVEARVGLLESQFGEARASVEGRIGQLEAERGEGHVSFAEEVVLRVSERVAEAESKTDEALAELRQSFADLDSRLRSVETPSGAPIEQRLEQLAADLAQRVEAARSEMAAGLAAASEGRFDRMERTLGEMSEHVRAAEQRSAEAIEQMGAEVRTVADTLNRRVEASEHRSAEAIEQVGGEMARIGQAMESRLARTDVVHAEALEKLGGEIARITERLAERMSSAERRSAQALDDMNEQVSRSTERMQQRQERASDDLAERIRLSEERTAKLLEEARETIDKRLAETQARIADPGHVAAPQAFGAFGAASFSPAAGLPSAEPYVRLGPAEPNPFADAAPAPVAASAFAQAFPSAAFPAEAERPAFAAEDFEAADGFAREPEATIDAADDGFQASDTFAPAADLEAAVEAEPDAAEPSEPDDGFRPAPLAAAFGAPPRINAFDPPPMAEPIEPVAETYEDAPTADDFAAELKGAETEVEAEDAPLAAEPARHVALEPEFERAEPELSAPEVVEGLEAAEDPFAPIADEPEAKSADVDAELAAAWAPPQDDDESAAGRPLTTREVIEQARAAARASQQNGDSKAKRARAKAEKDTKGGGLFSSFGLRPNRRAGSTLNTALLVTFAAAGLTIASAGIFLSQGKPTGGTPDRIAESKARDAAGRAIAAAEADTTPRAAIALTPQPMGPTGPAPDSALDAAALYEGALNAIAIDDPGGIDDLKTAANLGYAPAQFYLGKLFQEGKHGVKKDLVEARRWTERAALAGDRTAMHNFALNNYFGEGGPKDVKAAADWFRRAAELGLVDSQYNLGRLYEDGQGVTKNAAEAYKWYMIAARAGDVGAQGSLARVRAVLSPEAKNVAERAAAGFTPALPTRAATAAVQVDSSTQAVATAQKVLSRLSYYSGPADGVSSPALRGAIAAYQRDRGLPPTGSLDQATVTQLSVYTR